MWRVMPPLLGGAYLLWGVTSLPGSQPFQVAMTYHIEDSSGRTESLGKRFNATQLGLLEKLNRSNVKHLERLPEVVLPDLWTDDELSYSALPARYPPSDRWPKFLVAYLPGQLFGAYEFGTLVRWGPVSSGARPNPTRSGFFALNWRSTGRASTVDPDWYMEWYFNFGNQEGLAFHAYALPGYPASHGCIRLLERDAQWLFEWGREWQLDTSRTQVLTPGTPVAMVLTSLVITSCTRMTASVQKRTGARPYESPFSCPCT